MFQRIQFLPQTDKLTYLNRFCNLNNMEELNLNRLIGVLHSEKSPK